MQLGVAMQLWQQDPGESTTLMLPMWPDLSFIPDCIQHCPRFVVKLLSSASPLLNLQVPEICV
jgi:hypothetical protein